MRNEFELHLEEGGGLLTSDSLRSEAERFKAGSRPRHKFEEIVGRSEALRGVLSHVECVAPTDATVLISGETGTGKELIAKAIHNVSRRRFNPLIKVNCAALPRELIESELLGHEKGAFTGAVQQKKGRFESANAGTLFLDEVSELSPEAQAKLLRVMQEREFERVGGAESIRVDVRVVAASNRNLAELVEEGKFRPDLFYRVNVFPIAVPPLRERREDIPELVDLFLAKHRRAMGKPLTGLSKNSMARLLRHAWPGNVRELQNVVERAAVLARSAVFDIDDSLESTPSDPGAMGTLEQTERTHILNVLQATGWVIGGARGAAKILDIHPNTLRSRMQKLGIERPSVSGKHRPRDALPVAPVAA